MAAAAANCTSPRKLHEMTLPLFEGHDMTMASGISMKQYEDQLNCLKKENFHLKLRIYFLEEKLGTGAPPAVQGLLEHNVRLQVEVEELRRQLSDKQELLAAAAEAIDVLEQQGSMSNESVEASFNQVTSVDHGQNENQTNQQVDQTCDETQPESESAGEFLDTSIVNEGMNELIKLRRQNRKALHMIKECMKKIQQQDREMKKIKLDKELVYAQVSDSQLEKYEEIVKCKDEHIRDLEMKIRELQTSADGGHTNNAGNLQELLARRLQALAFFLDKLLSHKCVLGEDKKKLAESILEQSLALPVGLKLDESMAPEDLTMDESNLDLSQSMRIEDLTLMFGHHVNCGDEGRRSTRRAARGAACGAGGEPSESECWSEPDRTVSLARMGLREEADAARAAPHPAPRTRRSRLSHASHASRSEDKTLNDAALFEEIALMSKQLEEVELEKKDLAEKLDEALQQINDLQSERNGLNEVVAAERASLIEANKNLSELKQRLLVVESEMKELQHKLTRAAEAAAEAEATHAAQTAALRRAADEAAVQASAAGLERARAHHERLRLERELDEARDQLAAAAAAATARDHLAAGPGAGAGAHDLLHEPLSEEERTTSPDQGIDSDRLSSLEQNDLQLSPRSLYEENVTLKQKLSRTKATLASTLAQLHAANMRKRSVQRAICREIHKTQGVLRQARDSFEHQ